MTEATERRAAFVQAAELVLARGVEPATVGAVVTSELCGHWEHDGACRWPHNNEVDGAASPTVFRTLFVAAIAQELEVRGRIEAALRSSPDWRVLSCEARPVGAGEQALATRLMTDDGVAER